ncbi:hypothetical protein PMI16_00341 [Herbaspirillum sp. CF444]|nr:hypothetical protein PMI16_00341 [Herbaspirillum sp. CF444]
MSRITGGKSDGESLDAWRIGMDGMDLIHAA